MPNSFLPGSLFRQWRRPFSARLAMTPNTAHSTDRLPYPLYAIVAGLVLWLVIASWGFMGSGYAEVSLTVVTGFFAVVMGIPFVLWRVWLSNRDPVAEPDKRMPFAD